MNYKEKTNTLSKIIFIIGIILITVSVLLILISFVENKYNVLSEIFLSLSIILLSFSAIIYFLKRQFDKLANIADKIEDNEYNNNFNRNNI